MNGAETLVCWAIAFAAAIAPVRSQDRCPWALGIGLGALTAHAAWLLLYADRVFAGLWGPGFTALGLPFGPWLVCGTRALERNLWALCTALGVARLGCFWDSCLELPGLLLECSGVFALATLLTTRRARERGLGVFFVGLGMLRLLSEPWRPDSELGEPIVPACAMAGATLFIGAVLTATRSERRRERER